MRVGSLFTGIGGLDLGLERAGMTIQWQAETDPYCRRVLAKHWPDIPNLGDVTAVEWSDVPPIDLVAGGFPCQPVSNAGRRRAQDDERWLWPEFHRCIRLLRPRLVLVENVPGLLVRGMGDVLGDLAAGGYDADWTCISAASVGAPHIRDRVWIVAARRRVSDTGGDELRDERQRDREQRDEPRPAEPRHDGTPKPVADTMRLRRTQPLTASRGEPDNGRPPIRPLHRGPMADTDRTRLERHRGPLERAGEPPPTARGATHRADAMADTEERTIRPGLCEDQSAGLRWRRPRDERCTLDTWPTEPNVGRVAHGIPDRVDRLRALGNAVVPQVAEYIGRRIMEAYQ